MPDPPLVTSRMYEPPPPFAEVDGPMTADELPWPTSLRRTVSMSSFTSSQSGRSRSGSSTGSISSDAGRFAQMARMDTPNPFPRFQTPPSGTSPQIAANTALPPSSPTSSTTASTTTSTITPSAAQSALSASQVESHALLNQLLARIPNLPQILHEQGADRVADRLAAIYLLEQDLSGPTPPSDAHNSSRDSGADE
ncbi:hypothetical protein CYLTODRAFT_420730 [Cylindrobasidium torrendii FP15055 ss-10]|uniref:Uncharacterized protein n=1 Tax=Cylindrobasidium torrendii FP15055 ss-10 TaxID=1314674 RepID=A0A0D7BH52_9AGAR|nr:hypothetical protein CYLTODRAFT_420730 [Cylindrobasidium torrendii FP15055 ss-10]